MTNGEFNNLEWGDFIYWAHENGIRRGKIILTQRRSGDCQCEDMETGKIIRVKVNTMHTTIKSLIAEKRK